MLENYEREFTELFRRLMRLEIILRERLLFSAEKIYGDKTYEIFKEFFINPYIYERYDAKNSGNKILKIIKNKHFKKNTKFVKLIYSLYLSHLLEFVLTYKQFYSNVKLLECFYKIKPKNKHEFQLLRKKRDLIKNLRNDVIHFNFENYEDNKENYLEALSLFEIHLGCQELIRG